MQMTNKVACCLVALSALGVFAEGERTLSEDGKTLTFNVVAGAVYTICSATPPTT